jgi:3-oxoacyl-[acyl-carrier protein] reductase
MTPLDFEGKTALITGGTRGLGKAVALRLSAEGARVALVYHTRAAEAEQTLEEIRSAGGSAVAVSGDVSSPEDVNRCVADARQAWGPIDILVHSAGVAFPMPASEVTWEIWKKTMNINLDGTFNMIYAVKDEMIERKFGRIVTIASIAGLRPRAYQVPYSTSKAAVIALTRSCAEAWAGHNIRINCISPGLFDTEMAGTLSDEVIEKMVEATPMQRMGRPEEIAALARFLVSEESSFMTGQTLVASGGRVMLPG